MTKSQVKIALFIIFSAIVNSLFAQNPAKYWIEFRDKNGTPFDTEHPQYFISERAIELRKLHNIAIDERDLPVNPAYIDKIVSLDTSIRVFTKSKWLNGISIYSENDDIVSKIEELPFVKYVELTNKLQKIEPSGEPDFIYETSGQPKHTYLQDIRNGGDFDYGDAGQQVRVNNVHWLHRMGYRGENMQMMVLDGGFDRVDSIACFEVLRNDNRLLGARNIVQPWVTPLRWHSHGTMVLSCIASYIPGKIVGTAPMAQFYLCQTEDSRSESRAEEDNWVAGLELADSMGCQVLNSSLGYTTFDDTINQRVYADLNGQTSRASRAATIAASKGLLICNSAGNEGGKKWKYIGAPADAKDIITVGAVNIQRKRAVFSSYGPTSDGRTKPDACAVGRNTYVSTPQGIITISNGTSFSSPMLAGMVACLWQAFPNKNNYEIMDAIRRAGDRYPAADQEFNNSLEFSDDNGYGYGITDFLKAYNILKNSKSDDFVIPLKQNFFSSDGTLRFALAGSIYKQNYQKLSVTATPVEINGEKFTEKKPIRLKITKKIGKSEYSDELLLVHEVYLPKLPKSKSFQIYKVDFDKDGKITSLIIGQER